MSAEKNIRSSHVGLNVRDLDRSMAFYEVHLAGRDGPWNHVCMRVADFDESYRRLIREGIQFETEKLFMKEFWENGMKFAFFRGPDGERLEIAEY